MARLMLSSGVRPGIVRLLLAFSGLISASASGDEVIRVMAANTSSGNYQSYDPGHGNRIFQGLDPDIALVQEMNVTLNGSKNSPATYRAWVDDTFGSSFFYHVETGKSIPNGIVSRYPFINTGVWEDAEMPDREFVWARIDLPGDMNLLAVSVHLSSGGGASTRNTQAGNLRTLIQNNKLATDHVVIGGDFNTDNRSESCLGTLSSVVVTAGPWPADQAERGGTNASRAKPYDWVAPGASLAALSTPLVIGSNTFANGLVFDSRVYSPLSAVSPVESGDSGASGMQHMAVMRAFLIPTNEAPVIAGAAAVNATLSENNHPVAFSLSLQASDGDSDPLSWSISSPATHGSAGVMAPVTGNGAAISYHPESGYTGADSFIVEVTDGRGGSDSVTVSLTVEAAPAYDRWTYDSFGPLDPGTEAGVWGDGADPDGDGYTNLEEFAHGLAPHVADFAPNLLSCSRRQGEDGIMLSYTLRMDGLVPALDYTVQVAADLDGTWETLSPEAYQILGEENLGGGFKERSIRFTEEAGATVRFFRLVISR